VTENKGMRIVFDGRQVESLDPKIARRIGRAADSSLVEGVILSIDQVADAAARRYRISFGWLGGVAAAILIVVAIIALDYEPADMVVIGPVYLLSFAAIGAAGSVFYRRRMAQIRDKAAQRLARMAPPGTAVRLDAAGLTFGGRATPWSDIAIEAVEIVTVPVSDGDDDYRAEAVVLDIRDQSVILDQSVIANGRVIVDKVLRTLGVDFR
jgi:hypothetical protein